MHKNTRMNWLVSIIMLLLGLFRLSAQDYVPVNDSVNLLDLRFFHDKKAGQMIRKAFFENFSSQEEFTRFTRSAVEQARKSGDHEAEMIGCALLGSRFFAIGNFKEALDYHSNALSVDSLTGRFSPVRERALKIIAGSYSSLGAKNMAATLMHEVISIAETRDKNTPSVRLYQHYNDMAVMLTEAGFADSAVYYYRKATKTAYAIPNRLWYSSSLNNLGYSYLKAGRYDSAEVVLKKSRGELRLQNRYDSLFMGSITDNLAQVFEKQNRAREALDLYLENCDRFIHQDDGRYLNAAIAASRVYTLLGDFSSANRFIAEASSYAAVPGRAMSFDNQLQLLHVRLNLALATGQDKEGLAISRQLSSISDSLLEVENKKKLAAMDFLLQEKSAKLKAQLQMERIARLEEQSRARYNRLLTYGVALLGILVVALVVLLLRRRISRVKSRAEDEAILRQLAELRLTKEQLDTEKLNKELELKRRDLTDMAVNITARKKLADEWLEKLKKIKASKDPDKELQLLIIQLKNQDQGSEEKRLLPQHVEQVNHEFYEKLRTAYPGLTRMEIDLCGMIRMRLPIKEIAGIRGISSHAVRVAKHRLKKKMELKAEQELDTFIINL